MTTPKELIESQLPGYFLEQYPQFTKFVQEYYDFLESTVAVLKNNKNIEAGDTIYGSLSKAKGIVKVVSGQKIYFDYETKDNEFYKNEIIYNGYTGELYHLNSLYKNIFQYMSDIEENNVYDTSFSIFKKYFKRNVSLDHSIFRRLDPKTLTKRILDYYQNKGTENSYYWFFRIFFDEDIELYYPKVDILKLSDSGYYRQNLVEINFSTSTSKFTSTRILCEATGSTAISRQVVSTTRNNKTRTYIDLTYINGEFFAGDLIIGFDMVTGEKKVEGIIKSSITDLEIVDGGIGHQIGDNFTFADGRAEITKLEEYSITNIDILDPGLCYRVGDQLVFDEAFSGATRSANVFVEEIHLNETITEFLNSQNNNLQNNPISAFENRSLNDLLYTGGPVTSSVTIQDILPSHLFSLYEVGGIKSLRWEDSGLNYKFAPQVKAVNNLPEVNRLLLFDLILDDNDANTANVTANTMVTLSGTGSVLNNQALYVSDIAKKNVEIDFAGIPILAEDLVAKQFITQRAETDLENDIEFEFTHTDGSIQTLQIQDLVGIRQLKDTAELKAHLGDGIADFKMLEPGLSAEKDSKIKFQKPVDLDGKLNLNTGVLHPAYEEYRNNQSKLSSDKYFFDNYYYQWYSYEIITKIPASKIEPLLLDELHPAGFLHFIRNKFEFELEHRIKAFELPEIEIESQGYVTSEVYGYLEQEWENFGDQTISQILQKEIETDIFVDRETKAKPETVVVVEERDIVYQAFKHFLDDFVVGVPRDIVQQAVSEEQILVEPTDNTLFDFPGYLSNTATPHLSTDYTHYEMIMAVESFTKLINVEDRANWVAETIGTRTGPIETQGWKTIKSHRVHVDDLSTYITGSNPGGMIIARDPFQAIISSANTIGATFDSDDIHFANTKGDFSQSIYAVSADLSSTDIKFSSSNIKYGFYQSTAYLPVVTGNSQNKQGSYLPTAEILTSTGWVQFQDLKYGMKVAEVMADGLVKYTEPQEIYSTWFEGNIYTYTDNQTFSISVISDQELALSSPKQQIYKKKSSQINLRRSPDGMALVDDHLVAPGKNPIMGSIPLKNNVEVIQKRYVGPLYCVNINNFTAHVNVPFEATEVDMNELELHSIIDNAHAIPRIIIDETKRRFVSENAVTIDMSHVQIQELKSNTITFDFHNEDYYRHNAPNVANTYPEVAPTEIFFFNSFQIQGPTGHFGLSPSVQELPKTLPRSLEHIILAQPDVNITLTQQKVYEANPGAFFEYANTPNTYFAELGFESLQFSINEEFLETQAQPISLLLIEQYQNYFDLDERGRPIQDIVIENISLNLANVDISIVNTGQEDWQRNSGKLELFLQADVTTLGTENDPRNRSIALSFEQAIPAVQFKDNKPVLDSMTNLYNISHYKLPETVSEEALYRYKDYSFDDSVGINPMNRPEVMNDPKNRASFSVLTLNINPYQRSGKYRKLLYPFGFGSLYATFGNSDASFDLNTIYYEPGVMEVKQEEYYLNIVDLGNFTVSHLTDKPNIETESYFSHDFNVTNAEVIEKREWHWDFTYDLYHRQEFSTEMNQIELSVGDYVVVDQERELELNTDATIYMPNEFIFERQMFNEEYAYGTKRIPQFGEGIGWGSKEHHLDSGFKHPHKGRTFWDETNFDVHIDQSLVICWYDFDYEMSANNFSIDSTLISGGIDPISSYKDLIDDIKTVTSYSLEVKILNRWLFFDYRQKIRNDYRDWTKKYFDPYLNARSKDWLGDTLPSATGLPEPVIYLAPQEKKIPMVEYTETGLEGNTNFIDSTVGEEDYSIIHADFDVLDRNTYFQTTDIIKPWVGVRIYDWYKSKFAEYFGDKIPSVKVTSMPAISTSFHDGNTPNVEILSTLLNDEASFMDQSFALQDTEMNFGGWRQVKDRNRLFALDGEINFGSLNRPILNMYVPQEIVTYYKDALPGVEVTVFPRLQFDVNLSEDPDWGIPPPTFAFDQIVYFPNTTYFDSSIDLFKQDHIKIDTSIVNRNTTFALRDVYHHRWGNRFIEEFMKIAIRLRDWGGDTIPSATAVPQHELEYGPQLYFHYGDQTGDRYIDQQFSGVDFSHDINPYYIQQTTIYDPNTVFHDATSYPHGDYELEVQHSIIDSFSTFGLSGVFTHRWLNRTIKEFMKTSIKLRYWAGDTIPSVIVTPIPELEYSPQLYFHYGKNSDDKYVDEGFSGSNYDHDVAEYYNLEQIWSPPDATRFDATNEGFVEPKIKTDINILNSYDVFALNNKILPFENYPITNNQRLQKIKDWGGEAIPSVLARSWPEVSYKPQLYAHYDNAFTKNVDDSPESLIANKDVQKYYTLETINYFPNTVFLDATTDIEIPESQVYTDVNVLDRNQFISLESRVLGTKMENELIKDYILAEIRETNREHIPSVTVLNEPEYTYKPQVYGHYKKSVDQHVNDSPFSPIPIQNIQDYYTLDTTLYDLQGTFLEAASDIQLEFTEINTEKDHISDRFIIRGDELITNLYHSKIGDFTKFSLVEKTPDITRTAKTNTDGEHVISIPKELNKLEKPFTSPFIESTDTILQSHSATMLDGGLYMEEVEFKYVKFDDMRVDETFLNLNNEITEDLLATDITRKDLARQTRKDVLKAHHTVDAVAHYTFSMYNEFDESRKERDILQTKLKEVSKTLYRDSTYVDATTDVDQKYVYEFLNEIKNSDRMIDLKQVFEPSMLNDRISDIMDTFEITDNIRSHIRPGSIETLTEQMFEILEFMPDLNSNTFAYTTQTFDQNIETVFNVFRNPEINTINSKTLSESDFLITKVMAPYMDVDIYKMNGKKIKIRNGDDYRTKFTNTSAKLNGVMTEGFSWNISQLNTFKTNWETSVDNEESMLPALPLTQLLDDFREAIANVTTIEATTNFYNEFNL